MPCGLKCFCSTTPIIVKVKGRSVNGCQSASEWEWLAEQGMLEGFPPALPFRVNRPTNMMFCCTFSSSLLWKLSSKCWKWVSDIWRSKDKRQETYSPCWPNEKLFNSDNLKSHKYKTQPGVGYKGRGLKWPQCLWEESWHAQRLKILHINSFWITVNT